MFNFNKRTNIHIAENTSAIFLCPDFTPVNAQFEEQTIDFTSVAAPCFDDTPVEDQFALQDVEYQFISDDDKRNFSVSEKLSPCMDLIACDAETLDSEEVISIDVSSDADCPMFQFKKHISPGFYITVCNDEFYHFSTTGEEIESGKVCFCVCGFVCSGMELKIRVQSFRL